MSLQPANCVLIAATLLGLLTACSAASEAVDPTVIDSPVVDGFVAEESVAPPKSITWEASCMLSVDEVTSIMSDYSWQPLPEPKAMQPEVGDTECDYGETTPDSYRHVSIDFRQYDPVTTYGWVSPNFDVPSFSAPNPVEGAQNACDTATAAQGLNGLEGKCTHVGTVPVVLGAGLPGAVVFPEGPYFYVVRLYGLTATESAQERLLAVASLIASRSLVSN